MLNLIEKGKKKKQFRHSVQEIWDTLQRQNLQIMNIGEGEETQVDGV